jgi:hypothetical protein
MKKSEDLTNEEIMGSVPPAIIKESIDPKRL